MQGDWVVAGETAPDRSRLVRGDRLVAAASPLPGCGGVAVIRPGLGDAAAGLAVAGLMLPVAVGYAGIAGLAPGRALIAAVAGGLVYAALGSSRQAIVSPTSSSAAILAAALGGLAVAPPLRDGMAAALTLSVGALLVVFSILRLGSLAAFVSRPVLRGFAFGLAISIVIRQLPKLTGVAVSGSSLPVVLAGLAGSAPQWHGASLALGAAALAGLLVLRRWPALPGALLLIAASIALASAIDLPALGIALSGSAPLIVPHFALPDDFAIWAHLLQLAAPLALIVFAESWGTVRSLALDRNDTIAPDRELRAIGLANCAAACVQGMPVGAGFSAGMASASAGAGSRVAGLVAALALLVLALGAQPLIARIPEPVLAATVIGALTHALSPRPLLRLFRLGRDQWTGAGAAVAVLAFGVLNGMLAAIALSIGELLYRFAHPSVSELGRVGATHDFVDRRRHPDAAVVSGVAIFRPNAPLFFANAEAVLGAIRKAHGAGGAPVLVLSLEESNDLDSTAAEALGEFAASLRAASRRLVLARAHDRVRDMLVATGLSELARDSTFSVADAVARATEEP